jgi:ubiquinone/menaquinone biosynthesis C-methylase UbiE
MESQSAKVREYYDQADLAQRIKEALIKAGLGKGRLSAEDLAPLDQFHSRGLKATVELAELLNPKPGTTVVDIGSGLGGPSRYLAAHYGCRVHGVDLSPSFVDASIHLAERAGLSELVSYECANALSLPFENSSFDIAWTQHVAMNIADRPKLYAEAFRVLRNGGRLAIFDVLAGVNEPLHFPVPWSPGPETSFLLTESELRSTLENAGFRVLSWHDKTEDGINWFENFKKSLQSNSTPILGLHIAMGPEFSKASANLARNLQERKAILVETILEKP